MNHDPTWSRHFIGVLQADSTLYFAEHPELRVTLQAANPLFPETSWWPENDECVLANWKAGEQFRFSMFLAPDGWCSPMIYNPQKCNGANFPCHMIKVEGWEAIVAKFRNDIMRTEA